MHPLFPHGQIWRLAGKNTFTKTSTYYQTVEFNFYPQNHSVVRAEYEYPCIPYEMTGVGKRGFFSGFNPVDAILSSVSPFSLMVSPARVKVCIASISKWTRGLGRRPRFDEQSLTRHARSTHSHPNTHS
ncbi:hypothetical protein BS50DRAFT_339226 [Corynespora cassiicola Philippines]|uniref:Uncharacterized protein n=1 Tax=Corynespora cassiicola Philippines TaxID=1448308 RepID=A0A2T2NV39_CORCC|nr:hypothetical protein BS50DRAFT_339226 [Corynespora cassiicola Philippines]